MNPLAITRHRSSRLCSWALGAAAWLATFGLILVGPPAKAASYDYWLTGNPADAQPAKTRAGLLMSGGGGDVTAAWKWFLGCAGHGDIVVLRASGANGYNDREFLAKIGGTDSIETIRFNDASAARDPRVLEIIAKADGIFLAGGDQSKYTNYWKGTPVGTALNAHLRAGKPLGGTSAGLAVLGEYYFDAQQDSISSATALVNPFDPKVTLGRDFIGAPALAGVITDSHFMARERLGRLVTFLARLWVNQAPAATRLVGLGFDEATALCVEPEGAAQVFTEKNGLIWLVVPTRSPEVLAAGQPLVVSGVQVTGIGPQSSFHLTTLHVDRPAVRQVISARDGNLSSEPVVAPKK